VITFVWVLAFVAIALWSLLAWALHALLGLDAAALVGDLRPLIQDVPYGGVVEQWIPGWQALLHSTISLAQTLLGWLGGAAGVIVMIIWGLGAAVVVGTAAVLTFIIRLIKKDRQPPLQPGRA
jgi:hypothetical protein